MTAKEMDCFTKHCERYLRQSNGLVFHSSKTKHPHIDILKYPPNDHLPYWKLVSMGASDIKLPQLQNSLGNRNEYILFIDPDIDLNDHATFAWFANKLLMIAMYPKLTKTAITYGHSVEWGEEEDSQMVCAYLEMPQVLGDPSCMRCKLSFFKQTVLLQPVMLTREETNCLLKIGAEQFSYHLYPEDESMEMAHFISERYRTDKF